MAKLTDRQKNNILAKWHTGQYTKVELAKQYKVTEKVVRNIVGLEKPANGDIIEAQTALERFKKSEKSPSEIQAINNAVKDNLKEYQDKEKLRDNVFETGLEIVKGIKKLIQNGKAQKVTTANLGEGIIEANIIETELQASDYKQSAEGLDKVAITLEVAQRHAAAMKIDNTNAQQVVDNNLTVTFK